MKHMQSQNELPLISVIVAIYNISNFLHQCLDSLIAQTISNAEFILIDDGSTDGSYEICEQYAKKDSRIRLIHKSRNEGSLLARKTGILNSAGKWIVFVDGDDFLPQSNCLKTLGDLAEEQNVDILQFGYTVIGANSTFKTTLQKFTGIHHEGEVINEGFQITKRCFIDRSYSWTLWNKVFRSEVLKASMDFIKNEHFILGEDRYCFFLFGYFAKTFKYVNTDPKYVYRVGSGVSTKGFDIRNFELLVKEIWTVDWIEEFLVEQKKDALFELHIKAIKQMILDVIGERFVCLGSIDQEKANSILEKYFKEPTLKEMYLTIIKIYNQKVQKNEIKEMKRRQRWYRRCASAIQSIRKQLFC